MYLFSSKLWFLRDNETTLNRTAIHLLRTLISLLEYLHSATFSANISNSGKTKVSFWEP